MNRVYFSSSTSLLSRYCSTALHSAVRFATFQSKEFYAATKDVPTTPGGKNPYELFEMPITRATTLDELAKQKRELVQKYHPDAPGGSTEKMAEINAAHTIIKEHHSAVVKRFGEVEVSQKAQDAYRQHRSSRQQRDEDLGRSGGINRKNVKAMNQQQQQQNRPRTQKELEAQWEVFRTDTENAVVSMCRRYELAVEQGRFFRKSSILNEITVRERWLRKSFVKGVWEDVHEMRGELLRKGARNAQQSQLAEEMVAFAGSIQRKLNEDFSKRTQDSVQSQARMVVQRTAGIALIFICTIKFFQWFGQWAFSNSLTVKFRPAILGY